MVCFPVGMGYTLQRTSGFSTNEPRFLPWGVTYAGMTKRVAIWSLGTEGLWRRLGLLGWHWRLCSESFSAWPVGLF